MNDLTIIDHQGKKAIDSRQVADMVEKNHADLLRSIKGYVSILAESNFAVGDFFIESTYQDSNSQTRPCYLLTRKGCDMVANKMTGEKGVLFTATYVTKFEEMEKQLTALPQMSQLEILAQVAQAAAEQEKAIKQLSSDVQGIRDIVALNPHSWRDDTKTLINKMATQQGGPEHIQDLRRESYDLLNTRMGVSVESRLTNKRRRMADEGVCKSKRDKLNPLDVIGEDKKLIEGFVAIVKEMAIKYKA